MTQDPKQILIEIFETESRIARNAQDIVESSPLFQTLYEFAELLGGNPSEEQLQCFVEDNPRLLMGIFGWGDASILAFLTKPSIGTRFRADFCVLQCGQGGSRVHLIELEPSGEGLFTRSGDRARRHNGAWTQCRDWMAWINANKATFIRDLLETVRELPEYPERSENKSFRRQDFQSLKAAWDAFGGAEDPLIGCKVVIGRWAKMPAEDRRRLIAQNQYDNKLATVITYDQLARSAFERPYKN